MTKKNNLPKFEKEICGDNYLTIKQKLLYFWHNLLVNIYKKNNKHICENYFFNKNNNNLEIGSPSRILTKQFISNKLPSLLQLSKLKVLEIGCGNGSLCKKLGYLGYSGDYLGLDIFDKKKVNGFKHKFIKADAHYFDFGVKRFDLIISISTLEHLKNDKLVIDKIQKTTNKGALEIHFVPSGWGLITYLWHGYRQYTLKRIYILFGYKNTSVFALGGLFSFTLHFMIITICEMILKLNLRKKFPSLYKLLLSHALHFDNLIPILPTGYVIIRKNSN